MPAGRMPILTGRERAVANVPLKGSEMRALLLADFERLLANEGLLSPHLAYGRVSYRIRLTLHLDNAIAPRSESQIESHPIAHNIIAGDPPRPELAALEPPPPLVAPSPDSVVSDIDVARTVRSPNLERVRQGLSVPVEVKQQDGTVTTERVSYPPDESLGDGEVTLSDHTRETAVDWNLLDAVVPTADEDPAA